MRPLLSLFLLMFSFSPTSTAQAFIKSSTPGINNLRKSLADCPAEIARLSDDHERLAFKRMECLTLKGSMDDIVLNSAYKFGDEFYKLQGGSTTEQGLTLKVERFEVGLNATGVIMSFFKDGGKKFYHLVLLNQDLQQLKRQFIGQDLAALDLSVRGDSVVATASEQNQPPKTFTLSLHSARTMKLAAKKSP